MRHNVNFIRRRFPNASPTILAFVVITEVALLATGIGWLLFRA